MTVSRKIKTSRRDDIMLAALDQIRERGLGATRAKDVADALGVSEALVHYHFGTREKLVAEAYDLFTQMSVIRLENELETLSGTLNHLRGIIRAYLPDPKHPDWAIWLEAWVLALHDVKMVTTLQNQDTVWRTRMERIISQGVSEGIFKSADPAASAWRITTLMDGLGVQIAVGFGVGPYEALLAWFEEAVRVELQLSMPFKVHVTDLEPSV